MMPRALRRHLGGLALALLVLAAANPEASAPATQPVDEPGFLPERGFAAQYPNPRVYRSWSVPASKLEVIEVFDASQAAEDPIGTSLWLAHADGRKEPFSAEALAAAYAAASIWPRTEAQAWTLATLPALCRSYLSPARIWEPGQAAPPGVPPEVLRRLPARQIARRKGVWELRFASIVEQRHFGDWRHEPEVYLTTWEVVLRRGAMRVSARDVWSPFSQTQPTSLP